MSAPVLGKIKRIGGVAGNFQYNVEVTYPGEPTEIHGFASSIYGPPIVAISPLGKHLFVSQRVLDRIGSTLNPDWIRAYYAPREDTP